MVAYRRKKAGYVHAYICTYVRNAIIVSTVFKNVTYVRYCRMGFNCVVKRLRFRVLKANCESNYCDLSSPVLVTPMRCLLIAF